MAFRTRLGAVLLVSACPVLLFADAVSINSSCSLRNADYSVSPPTVTMASQVNPTGSCNVSLADPLGIRGNAYAGGTATMFLPVPGSPSTPVGAEIDGSIGVYPRTQSLLIYGSGAAQFAISLDLSFSTAGPVRDGFITASYIGGFGEGPDKTNTQTFGLSIGSFTPISYMPAATYDAGTLRLIPFTLGQDFLFHEEIAMQASAIPTAGLFGAAEPKLQWTFTLFEADGVTPVQIALATPEPSSLPLFGAGLLALLWIGRRRRIVPTP